MKRLFTFIRNILFYNKLEKEIDQRTQSLQQAKKEAEAANRRKSVFLANMSHEIRTPMNAILGFTEILKGIEKHPQKLRYLNNIYNSGNALLSLINDILDLSKIESGKMELCYSPVSIQKLLGEMQILFREKAQNKLIKFIIGDFSSVPEFLLQDEVRIRQILINLIGNAIKFTDKGHVRVAINAIKSNNSKEHAEHVDLTITVSDTGAGISAEEQKNIFYPFNQVLNKNSVHPGGSGLGLSIIRHIVKTMGGTITVNSEKGKGSEFSVLLPNIKVASGEHNKNNPVPDFKTIWFEPATILIADDIEYNREILATYLAPFDFNFIYAKNGLETIELAKSTSPDLILLDLKMPEMSGKKAAKILKEDPELAKIPIIAVSAFTLKKEKKTIHKSYNDYLKQPVGKTELVNAIMKILPHAVDTSKTPENDANKKTLNYTPEMLAEEINKLPETWRQQALKMAHIGLIEELDELIEKIQDSHPIVAGAMRLHLASFRLDLIVDLLEE